MVDIDTNLMRINLEKEVDESYDIVFGSFLFPQIANDLSESGLASRYAIITDSNVRDMYANVLLKQLTARGIDADIFSFEAGERSKSIDTCMGIISMMSDKGFGRDSAILALGGGVVGDLAGFIAAIFNRGIPYFQIPTTVVAQADSSIGGKTAVDTKHGKNLVGCFKQPSKVYVDVATLDTLSAGEYRSGLVETIKHGIVADNDFFKYLEDNIDEVMKWGPETNLYIAKANCRIKGNVVEQDAQESGIRRILNYGHTAGHAIEKLSDYKMSHGDAVSVGMMVAGRIAVELNYFSMKEFERQKAILNHIGAPITIPSEMSNDDIINITATDKKAADGKARYALPGYIGHMHNFDGVYATPVENKIVKAALDATRE